MATDDPREVDEVTNELERTRAELDRTLDELGRKLAPENLKTEAKTFLRDRLDGVRRQLSTFTSEHAIETLGTLAAVVAVTTALRRRRARSSSRQRDALIRAFLAGLATAGRDGLLPDRTERNGVAVDLSPSAGPFGRMRR